MNHRPTFTTLCLALLITALPLAAAPPEGKAPPAPSGTGSAERIVQILWDHDAPPPDLTRLLRQLAGPEEAGAVAKKFLDINPAAGAALITWSPQVDLADHACTVGFAVNISSAKEMRPVAREIADALVERLSDLLNEQRHLQAQQRLARADAEATDLQKRLAEQRDKVRSVQNDILTRAGRADVSPSTVQSVVGKLEDERQRLELELAGMEARLDAVQEELKAASARADKLGQADAVLGELEKAVAARQAVVEVMRRRAEQGAAAPNEVSQAEAELVDAKVQLLDRKAAAASRGGDLLAPLTREIQTVSIDIRDRKARLKYVQDRLTPLRQAVQNFQLLEQVQDQVERARRDADGALSRLQEIQRTADAAPFDRVIVTTAKDTPVRSKE